MIATRPDMSPSATRMLEADPSVFGPIALMGVALTGVAWILLGLQVALPGIDRARGRHPAPVDGAA